jgi:(p)ppGpp synthase/HD superfamily hydrolase
MKKTVDVAMEFMKFHHKTQTRTHGAPYWTHPKAVMDIIETELLINAEEISVTALLHDILEDTDVKKEELNSKFGKKIADNVELLSKNYAPDHEMYFERIKKADDKVKIVKLCDRIHNLRDFLMVDDQARIEKYINETGKRIIPILQTVSDKKLQAKIEELLLKALDCLKTKK